MNEMEKLLQNEELLVGMVETETPEELAKLFAEHNIQLEEGLTIEQAFQMIQENKKDELSEEALQDVNGGIGLLAGITAAGALVLSAGVLIFISGYAYEMYLKDLLKKKKKKKK